MVVYDAIDQLEKRDLDGSGSSLFNDVPVGDFSDPLSTLVILDSVSILDFPDGDYNFDGIVDAADYAVWRASLGSTIEAEADGNGDGVVDQADYLMWRQNYGLTTSTAALVATPEPAAAGLAFLACLTMFGRRGRQ